MIRSELERLSKEELIELVLRLQRPDKTSTTSSQPPSRDPKQQRENAKPGGAKPGHQGQARQLAEAADFVVDHRPDVCPHCHAPLSASLDATVTGAYDSVELPPLRPQVTRHRRLQVVCPC